jgi:hypothetical protein
MTDDAWIEALQARHRAALTNSEFLKAVRALSARYVERRSSIRERSPLDSDGKKAAFAAFYAPLHFLTTREIVRRLPVSGNPIARIIDLGCGTGVVSAAWARELGEIPMITGIDAHPWALSEASWNWRQLTLRGVTQRGDLVRAAEGLNASLRPPKGGHYVRTAAIVRTDAIVRTAIVAGWSVNELSNDDRARLLPVLLELARRGTSALVIEPLAKSAVPWWNEWASAFSAAGGHAAEWRVDATLPPTLRDLSEAAGFKREELTARTLALWRDAGGAQESDGLTR